MEHFLPTKTTRVVVTRELEELGQQGGAGRGRGGRGWHPGMKSISVMCGAEFRVQVASFSAKIVCAKLFDDVQCGLLVTLDRLVL